MASSYQKPGQESEEESSAVATLMRSTDEDKEKLVRDATESRRVQK